MFGGKEEEHRLDQPKTIKERCEFAAYNYKIFEEIKSWGKQYKQANAMENLQKLMSGGQLDHE